MNFKPNISNLNDSDLLAKTKDLAHKEREVLTQILHHLREIERRKLFSDLGYQSLFEYAVKELKYSEGQAGRRLQAMKLIKEIPEIEAKIASGTLSLSNISQAQSYFREIKKQTPALQISLPEKKEILKSLENQSAREAQKILIEKLPAITLPKEKERILSENHTQINVILSAELKDKIEELKSLLGPKSYNVSFSELIGLMTDLSIAELKKKKFGVKRSTGSFKTQSYKVNGGLVHKTQGYKVNDGLVHEAQSSKNSTSLNSMNSAPTSELILKLEGMDKDSDGVKNKDEVNRYISQEIKHKVWRRASGCCQKCSSQKNLQFDHIQPVAIGGLSSFENLRLLCFSCNQRHAIKSFGLGHIAAMKQKSNQSQHTEKVRN